MNLTDRHEDLLTRLINRDVVRRYWLDEDMSTVAYDILGTKQAGICPEMVTYLCKYLTAIHNIEGQNIRLYVYGNRQAYDDFSPAVEVESYVNTKQCTVYVTNTLTYLSQLIKALEPCEVIY